MADNKEIGRIGQRRYGGVIYEEFLHELRGKRGIEAYREMSENDDVVGAILFAIEMLVRQTDWNVEPGGDSQADIDAAEFVESCMNDMQNTWIDTISISIHASAREATALITKIHLKHHISFQHTVHKSPFNVNYPFQ